MPLEIRSVDQPAVPCLVPAPNSLYLHRLLIPRLIGEARRGTWRVIDRSEMATRRDFAPMSSLPARRSACGVTSAETTTHPWSRSDVQSWAWRAVRFSRAPQPLSVHQSIARHCCDPDRVDPDRCRRRIPSTCWIPARPSRSSNGTKQSSST